MLREVVVVREPARFAVVKKGKMENIVMGWWNRYVCDFEVTSFPMQIHNVAAPLPVLHSLK
jgi:hypothetical protein